MIANISIIGSRGIYGLNTAVMRFSLQEISKLLIKQGFTVTVAGEYQGPDAIKQYYGVNLCYFPFKCPDNYFLRKVYEVFNDIYFMITLSRKTNVLYLLGMTTSFALILPKILNKNLKIYGQH